VYSNPLEAEKHIVYAAFEGIGAYCNRKKTIFINFDS